MGQGGESCEAIGGQCDRDRDYEHDADDAEMGNGIATTAGTASTATAALRETRAGQCGAIDRWWHDGRRDCEPPDWNGQE